MTGNGSDLIEFGDFCLDVRERRLLKNGDPVHLQRKAFETLLVLVTNKGHLVTKEQLLESVWADAFVEDNNLTKNIYALRRALDSGDNTEYIETIPRVGYRFSTDHRRPASTSGATLIETVTNSRIFVQETIQEETNDYTPHRKFLRPLLTVMAIGAVVSIGAFAIITVRDRADASALSSVASKAEARNHYARGRALWETRRGQDLHEATLQLERSVSVDPTSALAHSALADAYAFDYANWKKVASRANEAILIDGTLGEPHASTGFVTMFWEWNFADAETKFKKAIELSPNYATAHQWYAMDLAIVGRKDAALWEIERALSLDPTSVSINADRCQMLYFLHRYDDALQQCQTTLQMNGGFVNAHLHLYEIYSIQGAYPKAVEEYFEARRLRSGDNGPPGSEEKKLRQAFAEGGIKKFWLTLTDQLTHPVREYTDLARHYARLGDRAKTVYWLRQAYEKQDPDLIFVAADPLFEDYHTDRHDIDFLDQFIKGR